METNSRLREAFEDATDLLESILEAFSKGTGGVYMSDVAEAIDNARAALAKPIKNCEVGTVKEQSARFREFCKKGSMDNFKATAYCAYECPCGNNYDCKLAWAQMPYEGV